jgi:hypothetical protein
MGIDFQYWPPTLPVCEQSLAQSPQSACCWRPRRTGDGRLPRTLRLGRRGGRPGRGRARARPRGDNKPHRTPLQSRRWDSVQCRAVLDLPHRSRGTSRRLVAGPHLRPGDRRRRRAGGHGGADGARRPHSGSCRPVETASHDLHRGPRRLGGKGGPDRPDRCGGGLVDLAPVQPWRRSGAFAGRGRGGCRHRCFLQRPDRRDALRPRGDSGLFRSPPHVSGGRR